MKLYPAVTQIDPKIVIENDVLICQIMHDYYLVASRKFYYLLEKCEVYRQSRGVVRKAQDEHFWSGPELCYYLGEIREEVVYTSHGNSQYVAAGDYNTIYMYWEGRVGNKSDVARIDESQREM